jgi:hypothetical protein
VKKGTVRDVIINEGPSAINITRSIDYVVGGGHPTGERPPSSTSIVTH